MTAYAYCGRFAPSPTGLLHAGSLVAALASWLDARAHNGRWLVRIEDIDPPRCQQGAGQVILQQLATCGLHPDAPPVWQSQRHNLYAQALEQLHQRGLAYGCNCTRKDIEAAWLAQGLESQRHIERPYPGTCRLSGYGATARSWRFALEQHQRNIEHALTATNNRAGFSFHAGMLCWEDRRLGTQQQDPSSVAGDFILQRADGLYAYQLAVVIDDAQQKITHVVRGEDLADNTARQLMLINALDLQAPQYLHTPLVRMPDGEKLSKQHGAPPLDLSCPLSTLNSAAQQLALPQVSPQSTVSDALGQWVKSWQATYNAPRD